MLCAWIDIWSFGPSLIICIEYENVWELLLLLLLFIKKILKHSPTDAKRISLSLSHAREVAKVVPNEANLVE